LKAPGIDSPPALLYVLAPDSCMIAAHSLTKLYGTFPAIANVSFTVNQGEIVGLLGPNGAGKSTTMRILACVLAPTQGTAEVAGHNILRESFAVRRHLGYMPEVISLYPEMAVTSYLDFVGKMKGLKGQDRHSRVHLFSVRGLFPQSASLTKETADLSWAWLYQPLFAGMNRLFASLRWVQHGHVHLYVLYIALTLLVLLVGKLG
jgi:hypothetical protein